MNPVFLFNYMSISFMDNAVHYYINLSFSWRFTVYEIMNCYFCKKKWSPFSLSMYIYVYYKTLIGMENSRKNKRTKKNAMSIRILRTNILTCKWMPAQVIHVCIKICLYIRHEIYKAKDYLKDQCSHHHSANITINVDFMAPNLFK